jgi:cell division protein FtsW
VSRSTTRRSSAPATRPVEHRMLLTATLCLLAAGAVIVYSASSARDLLGSGGDGTAFLVKYVIYGGIGLIALQLLGRVDLERVRALTPLFVFVALGLVFLTLVPGFGVEVNGGRRWLGAGPLQFQPSELLKLALVLYAARLLASRPDRVKSVKAVAGPLALVVGSGTALVAMQPDLGTALVIAMTMGAMLVCAGVPVRQLAYIAGGLVVLVTIFALLEPYRRARLTAFVDPWQDAGGAGFQSVQGQIALGSGGLFGVGLGQSVQKIFYLPEAHTDFILAVLGEELGVIGVSALLFLYGLLAYAGLRVAQRARGTYAQLLAAGLTSLILCQALLNVFAVLGIAPLTGVPLPFISYGSSNLMVLLASMGLLLNIADGGRVRLKVVEGSRGARSDRSRGNGGARGARAGGRRRAAG